MANSSEVPDRQDVSPHTAYPANNERHALPEPIRAAYDAICISSSPDSSRFRILQEMVSKQSAKALIPEADDAMPVEWGKLFDVTACSVIPFNAGIPHESQSKSICIFGKKG